MTNLDKLKEKINKLSAKEMAEHISDLYPDDACEMCVYDENNCLEVCEWGIERYLEKEAIK